MSDETLTKAETAQTPATEGVTAPHEAVTAPHDDATASRWRDQVPSHGGSRGAGRKRRGVLVPLLAVGLVASLGAAGWTARSLSDERSKGDVRLAVQNVANAYAVDLTTYNYTRLDADFNKVLGNSTGDFKTQYTAASASLRELIAKFSANATGKVLDSAVVSSDSGHAQVILFVDQTVKNSNSASPRIDRSRMKMGLEKQGGRWLISSLDLV